MRYTSVTPVAQHGRPASITIEGSTEEITALQAMLAGAVLVGAGHSGIPLRVDPFTPIDPRPDPATARHWPVVGPDGRRKVKAFWDSEFEFVKSTYRRPEDVPKPETNPATGDHGISVFVQGVGGYDADEAELARRCAELEAVGFECLRSPRGPEGKYWEVWYLPGTWACKDRIKGASLHEVMRFCADMRVGSVELVVQRLALVID